MDLGEVVCGCLAAAGMEPATGDVLVVAHKVVSKAEGAIVDLRRVGPGPAAEALAARTGKDPRLCQVILDESRTVVRERPGLVICEHRLGWVCANAGVDASNAPAAESVILLPRDPDASARALRERILARFAADVAVLVNDTHGRAHREGGVGVCIGLAGLEALRSFIGRTDRAGLVLRVSVEAVADEIAAAATLLQGQADEGRPLVLVSGLQGTAGGAGEVGGSGGSGEGGRDGGSDASRGSPGPDGAAPLRRAAERDLFR
jgi:coenzyme F420-0:L-glutamate ligase/coenzyme F420-1:gamma-L-glutamate ligase